MYNVPFKHSLSVIYTFLKKTTVLGLSLVVQNNFIFIFLSFHIPYFCHRRHKLNCVLI